MISELRRLLFAYKGIFAIASAVGLILGLIAARRQRPLFEAVGILQLPGGPVELSQLGMSAHHPSATFITEALTIKDDRTLNRVISELHLAENPAFLRMDLPPRPSPEQQDAIHALALSRLRNELKIQIEGEANVLSLSFVSRNPALAAQIVDRVMADFTEDRYKLRYQDAQRATEFMRPRLDALALRVRQQQEDLLKLQQRLDTPGFNPRHNQLERAGDWLTDNEVRARLTRLATEIRLNLLKNGAEDLPATTTQEFVDRTSEPSTPFSPPAEPAADGLDTNNSLHLALAKAEQDAASLAATLGPEHPELRAVRARIEALQASLEAERRGLLTAAENDRRLALLRERQFSAELQGRNRRNARLTPEFLQYDTEQRDYLFSRALFLRFLWRLRIASINKAYDSADATVIDPASIHLARSVMPSWGLLMGWTLLSLAAAALIVLRIELHLGTAHQRIDRLEDITGLRILSAIPKAEGISLAQLNALLNSDFHPRSRKTESQASYLQSIFDLKASLQAKLLAQPRGRTVLFTSAVPSEGKTTLSSSVAAVMARQGRRVLLIDADLRRPTVQRFFHLPGRSGLSSVLNGKSTLAEAVQSVPGAPDLHVLGPGPIPPISTHLIDSLEMQQLLIEATALYDYVLIDSPPILAVTDALLLAQIVDAVVWVVRDLKVGRKGLTRARFLLESAGAPVVGVALNGLQGQPIKLSRKPPRRPWAFLQRFRRA